MKKTIVLATVAVTVVAGFAIAMHHETDALVELDKQWGAAAQREAAVEMIRKVVADDVLAISPQGLGSKADMIEAAQGDDAPTGPYVADGYDVRFLTEDVAVMVHHAGEPGPHWSLHVWQKKDDAWMVVATATAPDATE